VSKGQQRLLLCVWLLNEHLVISFCWRIRSSGCSTTRCQSFSAMLPLFAAGEVAIDLQRVGNHCKDIAAGLHKVKADIKDRTPPSATLQLKQRNAALSDQQQTATRYAHWAHQQALLYRRCLAGCACNSLSRATVLQMLSFELIVCMW